MSKIGYPVIRRTVKGVTHEVDGLKVGWHIKLALAMTKPKVKLPLSPRNIRAGLQFTVRNEKIAGTNNAIITVGKESAP